MRETGNVVTIGDPVEMKRTRRKTDTNLVVSKI
jgi:hypothetical protein